MNPILVFDAETTGMVDFKSPSEAPHQPHIVQLAAILVDPVTRKTIASMDVIVRPEGWVIPADVSEIHGVTQEHALDVGVSESLALEMFLELWGGRLRVAHNQNFDARIIRIAQHRYGRIDLESWKEGPAACTAVMATPICKLPPSEAQRAKTNFKNKTPELIEAYRHFFGRDFENAHTAMADVMACRDIYFHMKDLKEAA